MEELLRKIDMRNLAVVILLAVLFSRCNSSSNYCGNSNRYDFNEIEGFDIYKETSIVKLGAFKLRDSTSLPMKNGSVDVNSFSELKTLNGESKKDLFKILVNYDLLPGKINEIKRTVVFCYNPRNAILFFDGEGTVIGYVELCFECFGYKKYPSSLNVGEFCDDKFEVLKDIFKKNGVQYGITSTNDDDEKLENLTKELAQHPDNPIILLSMSKMKIDKNDFIDAIKLLDRVITLDSTNRQAYYLRGHCRLLTKNFESAKDDFDRVLKLNPKVTQAYHERALAMIEIFEVSRDRQLLDKICDDLEMVESLGDSSITDLHQKYCIH